MEDVQFIQNLALILVFAGIAGWICQRIGLSVIVGYLAAGIVLGPYTPPGGLVNDIAHIETLGQVGLVFLMFGIGLRLSLRKLRRLGLSLLLSVFVSGAVIYYLTRLAAAAMGLPSKEGIFLAAMLMVSSSAIISKVLLETGGAHERVAQTVMGMMVLEDVVAVVMLTLLGSMMTFGEMSGAQAGFALGKLGAFVVLAGVGGLLFVPWLLRRLSTSASEELQTLSVTGILFGLAVVAHHSGYSLAMGAFLLGMIVSETPYRTRMERTMEGMRDVFTAVFFVAIGLLIDLRLLADSWWLILVVAALTVAVRTAGVTTGLAVGGARIGDALRAGLTMTPVGEFSFIIAQLGISTKVLPARFYPLIVGVSLATTLMAPALTRNAGRVSDRVIRLMPRWLLAWQTYYYTRIDALKARQQKNMLWQLSKKRIVQVAVEVLFVTGLLVFSEPLRELVEDWLGRDWLFPHAATVLFWVVTILLVMGPLVALWRNMSALCLLYTQVSMKGMPHAARLRPVVEVAFKVAAGVAMYLWLSALLPTGPAAEWVLLGSLLVALVAVLLLRRKLVRWHSEMEAGLQSAVRGNAYAGVDTAAPWLSDHGEWDLHAGGCTLPDLADCQGKQIAELDLRARFGCMVVGIERQGWLISRPQPDTVLYPRDKVLLIGTRQQLEEGRKFLMTVSGRASVSELEDVRMETLRVPESAGMAGRTLRELSPARNYHVQIVGIRSADRRVLNPGGEELLHSGDELLVIATPEEIANFKHWLEEPGPRQDAAQDSVTNDQGGSNAEERTC